MNIQTHDIELRRLVSVRFRLNESFTSPELLRQGSVREFLQELQPALSDSEIALSGSEIALSGSEIALSGSEIPLSGSEIARDVAELQPAKVFHPQNHEFSTAHVATFDQLPVMESE